MSEKLPLYVNMAALTKYIVPWSERTVRRKIEAEGFPAIKDAGGQFLFKRSEVDLWMKRHEVQAG